MLCPWGMRPIKRHPRKLSLSLETLRSLTIVPLEGVRGGMLPTVSYCTDQCKTIYETCFATAACV